MKKLITLTALILCSFAMLHAETPEHRKENPHEIRLGYAENAHELLFTESRSLIAGVGLQRTVYQTGHIFVEYQYRINNWFSAGCNIDYILSWHEPRGRNNTVNFSNKFTILPTARFTYLNYEMLSVYSSLSAGLHVAPSTALTPQENLKEAWGVGFDACLLGLAFGKSHWFGTFELGATTAMTFATKEFVDHTSSITNSGPYTATVTTLTIPVARLLRVSVGYRF